MTAEVRQRVGYASSKLLNNYYLFNKNNYFSNPTEGDVWKDASSWLVDQIVPA